MRTDFICADALFFFDCAGEPRRRRRGEGSCDGEENDEQCEEADKHKAKQIFMHYGTREEIYAEGDGFSQKCCEGKSGVEEQQ